MNKFPLHTSIELCEWLGEKGVGLEEAGHILTDMELGDSLGLALLKNFKRRDALIQEIINKNNKEEENKDGTQDSWTPGVFD